MVGGIGWTAVAGLTDFSASGANAGWATWGTAKSGLRSGSKARLRRWLAIRNCARLARSRPLAPCCQNLLPQPIASETDRNAMSEPTPRMKQIEAMLADEPQDVFLRYSLAMELRSIGRHAESIEKLRELVAETPPYVPAFFMAAQQLAQVDSVPEARTLLRAGIDEARKQGDAHAAGEMSEFLASLGTAE